MAARASLVINDGQATPIAHTFSPNSGDGNIPGVSVIEYEDRVSGIDVGFPRVTISTRKPAGSNRNRKIMISVKRPVLENVSNSTVSGIAPAPTVAYEVVARMEFIIPERSTIDVRKDAFAYMKNLLANATVATAVQDLESPW